MKTMMIMLSLCFCVGWSGLTDDVTVFTVYADEEPWQDTTVSVKPGDIIRITAKGIWTSGSWTGNADGDILSGRGCGDYVMPDHYAYSLIGRIDDHVFYIGKETFINVQTTGTLELSMNDVPTKFGDNSGSLDVRFEIL
ncbi:MAG: LecA/PA-IL family lectin [Planctomycetota bacterium]